MKVKGEDNVADGLTKHVDRSKLEKYMNVCGFGLSDGRHQLCLTSEMSEFFVEFDCFSSLFHCLQSWRVHEFQWLNLDTDQPWIWI